MTIRENETTALLEEGKKGKQSTVSHRSGNNVTPPPSSSSSSPILRFTGFLLSCVVLVRYVHFEYSSFGVSTATTSSIAMPDITNHVDIVSVVGELDNDQPDLDQLSHGFFDPSVSLAGDAEEVYFDNEVVDVEVSSSDGESGADYPTPFGYGLDAGGCDNKKGFTYCETLAQCISSGETCLEMKALEHCASTGPPPFNTATCPQGKIESSHVKYCGPIATMAPHVFGPSVWKFLHTISMHYKPNGNAADIQKCERFIDAFATVIPCAHCAWHYNQFLRGSKISSDMRLNKTDDDWNWDNRGSPCKNKKNLQQFFVDAHNNVGQHVQLDTTQTSGVTRPKFIVNDLDELYGHVFNPLQNKYVSSQEPEIFHPIILEAINLLAMNYATNSYYECTYEPLKSIKFACTTFLNTLPFMINHPKMAIHNTTTACESRSTLLHWVKNFEQTISNGKLAILSLKDRKKRYETRNICKHNPIWKLFPMHRGKDICAPSKVCNATEYSDNSGLCVQPWIPVVLKNVPTP